MSSEATMELSFVVNGWRGWNMPNSTHAATKSQNLLDILVPPRDVGIHRELRLVWIALLEGLDHTLGHFLVRSGDRMPSADLLRDEEPQPQMQIEDARDRL